MGLIHGIAAYGITDRDIRRGSYVTVEDTRPECSASGPGGQAEIYRTFLEGPLAGYRDPLTGIEVAFGAGIGKVTVKSDSAFDDYAPYWAGPVCGIAVTDAPEGTVCAVIIHGFAAGIDPDEADESEGWFARDFELGYSRARLLAPPFRLGDKRFGWCAVNCRRGEINDPSLGWYDANRETVEYYPFSALGFVPEQGRLLAVVETREAHESGDVIQFSFDHENAAWKEGGAYGPAVYGAALVDSGKDGYNLVVVEGLVEANVMAPHLGIYRHAAWSIADDTWNADGNAASGENTAGLILPPETRSDTTAGKALVYFSPAL